MRDPAVVNREEEHLGPLNPDALPVRPMHIAGIEGRAEARILSKHPGGPATRLVTIPAGWGTDDAGAFDADVEVFVIDGALTALGTRLGPHSLLVAPAGAGIPSLRCDEDATVLLATAAPVRFGPVEENSDTAVVVSPIDLPWVVEPSGLVTKTYDSPGPYTTRLVFAGHVSTPGWLRFDTWSERLVLQGEWYERTAGVDYPAARYQTTPYAYVSRPAGTPFDGPRGGAEGIALVLDRVLGSWTPSPSEPPTHDGESAPVVD